MELITTNVDLMTAYDNDKINFETLSKFIQTNTPLSTSSLTVVHGKEQLSSFVDKTLTHMKRFYKENGNKEELKLLTQTLRLCAREEDLFSSSLYDRENVQFLFQLAGFSLNGEEEIKSEWDSIKSEAIKCLVNVFIRAFNVSRSEDKYKTIITDLALEFKISQQIVNQINKLYQLHSSTPSTQVTIDQVTDFMIFTRILFHLTVNQSFVDVLLEFKPFSVAKLVTQCGLLCLEEDREKKYKMVLIDVMKVLYNLTERFGPVANDRRVEPSQKLVEECFILAVPILKHVLALTVTSSQDLDIKIFTINFAINMPPNIWVTYFDGRKVLPEMVELFKVFMEEEVKKQQFVTPMLVLLANIAKHIPPTRNVLFPLFFPNEIEEREDVVKPPVQIQGTFGEKIVQMMFSSSDTLKILSGELLWEICGEDASNLSRTVGFGNAAGFLAYKGMLKMFNPEGDNSPKGSESSNVGEEETDEKNDSSSPNKKFQEFHFNDVNELHQQRRNENDNHKEPTLEEIREWEELMEKFDKLEKLGIKVHMQTKDDKDEKK